MKVPYLPTEQDLSSLPHVVASAIVNYNRAFSYYSKHMKMFAFYRAINGTGMKPEDQIAMGKARENRNRAEIEMWAAFDLKEKTVRDFNADPQSFWDAEQVADEDNVIEGLHYVDEVSELRVGL
jgi:hypothetical protein